MLIGRGQYLFILWFSLFYYFYLCLHMIMKKLFFFFWSHSSALRVVLSNIGVVSLLCSAGKPQSLTNSSETTINWQLSVMFFLFCIPSILNQTVCLSQSSYILYMRCKSLLSLFLYFYSLSLYNSFSHFTSYISWWTEIFLILVKLNLSNYFYFAYVFGMLWEFFPSSSSLRKHSIFYILFYKFCCITFHWEL